MFGLFGQKKPAAPSPHSKKRHAQIADTDGYPKSPEMSLADKLNIIGGGLRDLDPLGRGGNMQAAHGQVNGRLAQLQKDMDVRRQIDLMKQATQGMNPQQQALAMANPQAFTSRQINNQFQDPLAVRSSERQDALAESTINNTNFNQGMATDKFEYQQGRDGVMDGRYANEWEYRQDRDDVGDQQWQQAFDYRGNQDAIANGLARQRLDADAQGGSGYFGTTVPYRKPDGSIGYRQLAKDGNSIEVNFGEGAQPLSPQEIAGQKAFGSTTGKATGEAQAGLPNAIAGARDTLRTLDFVRNHPGMKAGLGPIDGSPLKPDWMKSDDARGFDAAAAQLQGQAFLQGYQQLKGAGVITDFEGGKAEDSLARLNRAQSPKDYKAALDDFGGIVARGMARQYEMAGQPVPDDISAMLSQNLIGGNQAPVQGQEQDGYIFLGGDPSNPQSWRRK